MQMFLKIQIVKLNTNIFTSIDQNLPKTNLRREESKDSCIDSNQSERLKWLPKEGEPCRMRIFYYLHSLKFTQAVGEMCFAL